MTIDEPELTRLIRELERVGKNEPLEARQASAKAAATLAEMRGERALRALAQVLAGGSYGMPLPEKRIPHLRGARYPRYHCNNVHKAAYDALKSVGRDAIAPLIEMLGAENPETRLVAAGLLYELGEKKWLYQVIKGLDEDLERLGSCGDRRAVSALLYALSGNGYFYWDSRAARLLGQIGDPRAIQPLLDIQKSMDKRIFSHKELQREVEKALELLNTPKGAVMRRLRLRLGGLHDGFSEWLSWR